MIKKIIHKIFYKSQLQDKINDQNKKNDELIKIVETSQQNITKAIDNLSELSNKIDNMQKTIDNKLSKKGAWVKSVPMIIVTILTTYIAVVTFIQDKAALHDKLNATWSIDYNKTKEYAHLAKPIILSEDSKEQNIFPEEIYFNLGEMNDLTGEMTIIDHHNKKVLYLFVEVEPFKYQHVLTRSNLYISEWLFGVFTSKKLWTIYKNTS